MTQPGRPLVMSSGKLAHTKPAPSRPSSLIPSPRIQGSHPGPGDSRKSRKFLRSPRRSLSSHRKSLASHRHQHVTRTEQATGLYASWIAIMATVVIAATVLAAGPRQWQTATVDDSYADLAHDYEWLFADEAIGDGGTVGATSPGSKDLLEGILETLPAGTRVLDSACGIGVDAMALARRGFNVTVSDGSAGMVAEARRRSSRFGIEMEITQSSWQALPERLPGPFDLELYSKPHVIEKKKSPRAASKASQ